MVQGELCELCCKPKKKIVKHHLKYKPEIKVLLCMRCHFVVHTLSKFTPKQRKLLLSWIDTYGKYWKGRYQYRTTESYRKESIERAKKRSFKKKDEIAKYQKQYYEENKKDLNAYHRRYKKTEMGKQHTKNWNSTGKAKKYKHDWYLRNKKKK